MIVKKGKADLSLDEAIQFTKYFNSCCVQTLFKSVGNTK